MLTIECGRGQTDIAGNATDLELEQIKIPVVPLVEGFTAA